MWHWDESTMCSKGTTWRVHKKTQICMDNWVLTKLQGQFNKEKKWSYDKWVSVYTNISCDPCSIHKSQISEKNSVRGTKAQRLRPYQLGLDRKWPSPLRSPPSATPTKVKSKSITELIVKTKSTKHLEENLKQIVLLS